MNGRSQRNRWHARGIDGFEHRAHRHGWAGGGPAPRFGPGWRGRGGGFGFGGGFGPGFGPGPGPGPAGRVRRGDVRIAIVVLLSERAMHGYEIIQELAARTNGAWRPSPGSIYPTLQLLEDEGLVSSEEDAGKRRFSLTDAGRELVAQRADQPAPWAEVLDSIDPGAFALRETTGTLIAAITQVARAGTADQQGEAGQILDEARRKLYALLAGEASPGS